jgi:quinoprotein glucose dehydrogenase
MLDDSSPRVVSLAAIALSNHGHKDAVEPAIKMLENNDDNDVVVRHAGIMVLTKCGEFTTDWKHYDHRSSAVRRAIVIALRRHKSHLLETYFGDRDQSVRQEAIRAAYEMDVRKTYRALSNQAHSIALRVSPEIKWHPLTARRAIFAAWVLGQEQDAEVIAKIAADPKVDFRTRKDALIALLEWNNPPVPDPVTGFARTLPENRIKLNSSIVENLKGLLDGVDKSSVELIPRALILSEQDQIPLGELRLTRYLKDEKYPEEARVKSMKLLAPLKESNSAWPFTLQKLFADKSDKVRSMARELLFKNDPDRATAQLGNLLTSKGATLKEKQLTLQTLTKLKTPKAKEIIKVALDQLTAGKSESGLALDIFTAAEKMALSLDKFRASLDKDDPNAEWNLLCRDGGDIKLGKKVFYEHGAAQCQRCHTMHGVGGNVGPELGAIGKKHDSTYLLRSLINPGAEVAVGYGLGTITLKDGTEISGNFMPDDKDGNAMINFAETTKIIKKSDIAKKSKPVSAMPPMNGLLSKQEARDLVAFLVSSKKDKTDEGHK